jgi:hypothetical protein
VEGNGGGGVVKVIKLGLSLISHLASAARSAQASAARRDVG